MNKAEIQINSIDTRTIARVVLAQECKLGAVDPADTARIAASPEATELKQQMAQAVGGLSGPATDAKLFSDGGYIGAGPAPVQSEMVHAA